MTEKEVKVEETAVAEESKEAKSNEKSDQDAKKEALKQKIEEKISKLEAELESANKKAEENWDLALRTKAESENIKRRATIDVENAHKYSVEKFAKEMLNVVDSLERGMESINKEDESVKAILEGMDLTYKLLLDSLEKFGITVINPENEAFDPKQHEALLTQESDDIAPNHVISVIQKGFAHHNRVLRHAKVVVAKAKS